MPLSPAQAVSTLVPALAGVTIIGTGVPTLAQGIGIGLSAWTPTITIVTADVGSVGQGKGTPTPILLLPPILVGNLTAGFSAYGILGLMAPAFIQGLASGLAQLYLQSFTNTVHASVGSGAGTAAFIPPPAAPPMISGFASVGMTGEGGIKTASAIARGIENTFRTLILPQPIVGAAGPAPSAGVGTGFIV